MIPSAEIIAILYEAGEILKKAHLENDEIHGKTGLANFVTDYDVKIQEFLIEKFHTLMPEAGFFGEESTEGNGGDRDGYCFYIDPIDGTTNFIFEYHHSCISIGLSYKKKMIAGFIYNPYVDEMFSAIRGEGCFINGKKVKIKDIPLEKGIASFGCARYNESDTDALFILTKMMYLNSLSIRNGGSAALDLCRVAAGRNTVYLELKLQPYDYAAASIMIEEAGGVITQLDGTAITLDQPCSILAGTPTAVEQVRQMARESKMI